MSCEFKEGYIHCVSKEFVVAILDIQYSLLHLNVSGKLNVGSPYHRLKLVNVEVQEGICCNVVTRLYMIRVFKIVTPNYTFGFTVEKKITSNTSLF